MYDRSVILHCPQRIHSSAVRWTRSTASKNVSVRAGWARSIVPGISRWIVPLRSRFCINDLSEDEAARLRFQIEARAAVHLRHSNAVSVTDFGQTSEGCVYIVMELLEGRTLREILTREAPIETARAISMMLQASDAVAAAHEAGIIHRDLKPSNILVTQSADQPAVVKVLDFGIAKFAPDDDEEATTLAETNSVIGTPRYMSPEQYNGKRVDSGRGRLQFGCDSL